MTDLPIPGEHQWANKLNQAIEQRDHAVADAAQTSIDELETLVVNNYATIEYVDLLIEDVSDPDISDIVGLQAALDSKQPVGDYASRMEAVPPGGVYGQVLAKTSSANYATGWYTPGPNGAPIPIQVVRHEDSANTPRPDALVVWWIGSVEPLNAEPHDVWDDSEND